MLAVDTFSDADFDSAALLASQFLCPEPFEIKLTEVRTESYTNDADTHNARFVEFYNPGGHMDLALNLNNFKFAGLMSSDGFGHVGHADCALNISSEQYLVLYDPSLDMPECVDCNCTLTAHGGTQCEEAMYIPCDADPTTSGCGACTWDASMDNERWAQAAYDYDHDGLLSSVRRQVPMAG